MILARATSWFVARVDLNARRIIPAEQSITQLHVAQVIKVGTSSLLRPERNTLNLSSLVGLCEVVQDLKTMGMLVNTVCT